MQEINDMKQRRTTTRRALEQLDPQPPRRLQNGYDHIHEAGVLDGRYISCNPTFRRLCNCYGCRHDNEIPGLKAQIIDRRQSGIHFSAASPAAIDRQARFNIRT
jgi:hypothetical protein